MASDTPNKGLQERECSPFLLSTKIQTCYRRSLNIKLTLEHVEYILIYYLLVCILSVSKNDMHVLTDGLGNHFASLQVN